MKMTTQHTQILGHNKSSVKRKVHGTKCLHKEAGKGSKLHRELKPGANSVQAANPVPGHRQIRIEPATRSRVSDLQWNRYRGITAEQVSQSQRLLRVQT